MISRLDWRIFIAVAAPDIDPKTGVELLEGTDEDLQVFEHSPVSV